MTVDGPEGPPGRVQKQPGPLLSNRRTSRRAAATQVTDMGQGTASPSPDPGQGTDAPLPYPGQGSDRVRAPSEP